MTDSTRSIARFMLSLPPSRDEDAVILDNACGTGALTLELLMSCPLSSMVPKIHAVDISLSVAGILRYKICGALPQLLSAGRLDIRTMDSQDLRFPDETFTHSYTNFGIMFFSNPERGAAEIYRTLRTGGTAFVSTWEDLGYMSLVVAAQKMVRPYDEPWKLPYAEEWHTVEKLWTTLVAGGFNAGQVRFLRKEKTLKMESVDTLLSIIVLPFSERMQGWTEGERHQLNECIKVNMTEVQKQTASVDMHALIAIAEK